MTNLDYMFPIEYTGPVPGGIRFAFVSSEQDCSVGIFDRKTGELLEKIAFEECNRIGNLHVATVLGYKPSQISYLFYEKEKCVPDPFAKSFDGKYEYGSKVLPESRKGLFLLDSKVTSEDFHVHIPYEEAIWYQLHVRGFTKGTSSGVPASKKGTFAGVTSKIPYLCSLGITTVEFQPCYDFDECEISKETGKERINYWGYKTGYYYVPKKSYSSSADSCRELKTMIREFHKAGIEVVFQFFFDESVLGIDMIRILRFWASEYKVDGFRLLGPVLPIRDITSDPVLNEIKLVFDELPGANCNRSNRVGRTVGLRRYEYSYLIKRLIKGDSGIVGEVLYAMRRNEKTFGVINSLTDYQGMSLMDCVSYNSKHNEDNGESNRDGTDYNCSWNCGEEGPSRKNKIKALRVKQIKNALFLLLMSESVPEFFMGDEFGNSQKGNNNPYCLDDATTYLDWKDAQKNSDVLSFVSELIQLRKSHKILHTASEKTMLDELQLGFPDLSYHGDAAWRAQTECSSLSSGLCFCENYACDQSSKDEELRLLYIGFNFNASGTKLALPRLPKNLVWKPIITTASAGCDIDKDYIELEERSTVVLVTEKKAKG